LQMAPKMLLPIGVKWAAVWQLAEGNNTSNLQ